MPTDNFVKFQDDHSDISFQSITLKNKFMIDRVIQNAYDRHVEFHSNASGQDLEMISQSLKMIRVKSGLSNENAQAFNLDEAF